MVGFVRFGHRQDKTSGKLSLGSPVSRNTSFINPDGSAPKSWVGNVECWNFNGTPENYEDYGLESPEYFDREMEVEFEIERFMQLVELNDLEDEIKSFCESKGYKVVFI